jgi:hypothetical protein
MLIFLTRRSRASLFLFSGVVKAAAAVILFSLFPQSPSHSPYLVPYFQSDSSLRAFSGCTFGLIPQKIFLLVHDSGDIWPIAVD